MNRKIDHPIFADTNEVEEFVSRALDAQAENYLECACCLNSTHKSAIKSFEQGLYYICKDCWGNERQRAINEIKAIYVENEEIVPVRLIEVFFQGFWE